MINVAKLPGRTYNVKVRGVPLARPERRAPHAGPLGLLERGIHALRSHLLDSSGALNVDGLDVTLRALALAVIVVLNVAGVGEPRNYTFGAAWVLAGLILYNTIVVAFFGVPFRRAPGFPLMVIDLLVGSCAIIAAGGLVSPFIVLYYALVIGAALRAGLQRSLILVGGCALVLVALASVAPLPPGLALPVVVAEVSALLMAVVTTAGMRHAVQVETQRVHLGEREVSQLRRLNQYTQSVLSASPDLQQALGAVAAAARQSLGGHRALAVLTYQSMVDSGSDGVTLASDGYPLPPHMTSAEEYLLLRVTTNIETVVSPGEPQVICAPLVIGTEILGGIFVHLDGRHQFNSSELALFGSFARQMALAIRLAHLYSLERARAQRSEESERSERDLLTVVAHELRTPLTSIKTVVGALSSGAHEADHSGKFQAFDERLLHNLERSANRLAMLTDDLVDMAQLRTGGLSMDLRLLNLAELIDDIVPLALPLVEKRSQSISTDLPAGGSTRLTRLTVLGDKGRLEQVLLNLLSNAARYSPKGSTILIGATPAQGVVRVFVRDEGPGVDPRDTSLIFEKFYQGNTGHRDGNRKPQGLGLGLAIARAIVEMHGGTIGVTTAPGKGSTFYFELPHRPLHPAEGGILLPNNVANRGWRSD